MNNKVEAKELKEITKIYRRLSLQERFLWKRDADTLLLSAKLREAQNAPEKEGQLV